jgi:hypothetical protein
MATKAHHHSRRSGRLHRARDAIRDQWLVTLLARTLASIAVMIVARLLGLTTHGGR